MIPRGLRFDGAVVGAESEAIRSEHVSIKNFAKNGNASKTIEPLTREICRLFDVKSRFAREALKEETGKKNINKHPKPIPAVFSAAGLMVPEPSITSPDMPFIGAEA